jgi:hemerythrin-like domain-containing protein
MQSTEDLTDEHEDIATLLAILEVIASRLESKRVTMPEDLQWLFEFNRDFVLRLHHGKEERLFFPALQDLGVPEDPINILIADHEMMRGTARIIRGLIEDYKGGDEDATSELIDMLRHHVQIMKDHIENEEVVFFPLVNKYISREMDIKLAARLKQYGMERIGISRYIELHEILDSLKLFYGISNE